MNLAWTCTKCCADHPRIEETYFGMKGQHWTNGISGVKKALGIKDRAFSLVICTRCRYTEMFQVPNKGLPKLLDL